MEFLLGLVPQAGFEPAAPPQLRNTDGDPIALTALTYALKTTVGDAFEKLAPLGRVHGEDHCDEVTRDAFGAVASAPEN